MTATAATTGEGVTVPELGTGGTDPRELDKLAEELPDTVETPTTGKGKRDYKAERLRRKLHGPSRTRGRPKGTTVKGEVHTGPPPGDTPPADPEEEKALAGALAVAFQLAHKLIAAKRGPHWEMSDPEAELHGLAGARALAPFMPALGKWMPLATFLGLLVGSTVSRLKKDAELARARGDKPEATA